jgi:hypothetical protein
MTSTMIAPMTEPKMPAGCRNPPLVEIDTNEPVADRANVVLCVLAGGGSRCSIPSSGFNHKLPLVFVSFGGHTATCSRW